MSQGFEIIRARIKDDAVVLIDRLMRSKQAEVVLVLPKNSIIAADLNSLKILKEEAESIGKTLSLNTDNNDIKYFAETLGMLIYNPGNYKKPEKSESTKPDKKIKIMMDILPPSFDNRVPEENVAPEIDALPEESPIIYPILNQSPEATTDAQAHRTSNGVYETANKNYDLEKNLENFYSGDNDDKNSLKLKNKLNQFSLNRLLAFFAISGLTLFGLAMYLVLPKASVRVSLREIPLKTQIPVAVSKNASSLDLTSNIIPGQYFALDKTGSKTMERSAQIGGIIEIYNAYSAAAQKLVAGTRFETKDGKIFRIQNPIIVPGAKMSGAKLIPNFVKVTVIGDEASDDYLIGPSYFTIPGFKGSPKYAGFYAKSAESMAKTMFAALSKEELEKNKNELRDQLAQELKVDTINTLKNSDLQLIKGASEVRIDEFKVKGNILSMKIVWQALFFKEKDLRTLINYFVLSHFPELVSFSFDDRIVYPQVNRTDFKKGELFFTFNLDKNNALSPDIDNLKKELAGRNENEMRTIISGKTYINSAAISLWPLWVKKAPNNPEKINVTVDNQ